MCEGLPQILFLSSTVPLTSFGGTERLPQYLQQRHLRCALVFLQEKDKERVVIVVLASGRVRTRVCAWLRAHVCVCVSR